MEEEIDLRPYIRAIFRAWYWVIGVAVITALVVFGISSLFPEIYAAEATVAIIRERTEVSFNTSIETREDILGSRDVNSRRDALIALVSSNDVAEQVLAEIWRDVLNLEQVGIFDNFFELGGHSLLATQIISRIRQEFRLELPLQHLFEEPTIANLAEFIGTIQRLTEQSKEFSSDVTEEEIIL